MLVVLHYVSCRSAQVCLSRSTPPVCALAGPVRCSSTRMVSPDCMSNTYTLNDLLFFIFLIWQECTGSICLAYGLESCQCPPRADDPRSACELCCRAPGGGACVSSFRWNTPPYDVPDMYAKPGTPCNDYNGYVTFILVVFTYNSVFIFHNFTNLYYINKLWYDRSRERSAEKSVYNIFSNKLLFIGIIYLIIINQLNNN